MPEATVTVTSIFPPDPGKKNWKIKTNDGNFQVAPEDHGMFTAGETYQISYEDREYNGFRFKVFKAFTAETRPTPAKAAPAATQAKPNGNNFYKETSDRDAKRMFITSIVNAYIQAGKVSLELKTLDAAVEMAGIVWESNFGAMDDKVPY